MDRPGPTGGWLRTLRRLLGGRALALAEAESRAARHRLRDAIEVMPEGVVILDADGRYLIWNQRYAEMYHRSADLFAVGERLLDTLRVGIQRGDYPDAVGREEAWLTERARQLANPTGERHEQRLSDGRWVMVEERRTSDGGVIGLRIDITEIKRQAAALEDALHRVEAASRAKSDFLADMSHELRTPLNGVMGLAQALAATPLSPEQKGLVDDILASSRALDDLVTDFLDYGDAARAVDATPTAADRGEAVLRVLAADDNPTNRKVIELMLGAAGAQVVSVENGEQALAAWREGGFDLVLMDLRMPVMDGLEAIRAIRRTERLGFPRAPIIVISANTSPEDLEASSGAGADRHIGKPVRAEELFAAITQVLAA